MQGVYIDWGYGMGIERFSSYKTAEKVYKKLKLRGWQVKTRSKTGQEINLEKRINEIKDSQADILIYIDSNWSGNINQKGIETYYNHMSKSGDLLAQKVQRELIKATNFYNRGIKCSNHTKNPNIHSLLEIKEVSIVSLIGFYSNTYEREKLEMESFQELISDAIVKGLEKYFKISEV